MSKSEARMVRKICLEPYEEETFERNKTHLGNTGECDDK